MRGSSRSSAAALHLCDRTLYQPQPGAPCARRIRPRSRIGDAGCTRTVSAVAASIFSALYTVKRKRRALSGPAPLRSIRASVVLEASRRAGALVAPPVGIGRGEAVVAERLVDVFAPALGHVAGVAQALIANLVRPAAEELVLAPGARQERAEKKPGRKSGDADQHRVLVHEALHRAAVLAHVGQGAANGLELAGALVIGAARPLGSLLIGSLGVLRGSVLEAGGPLLHLPGGVGDGLARRLRRLARGIGGLADAGADGLAGRLRRLTRGV